MDAMVQPPMMEREMVDIFTGTLQGQYYTSCSTSDSFTEMVTYGERIEIGINLGKIQDMVAGNNANAGNTKKSFGGHQKKKENEASMVYSRRGEGRFQYTDHHIDVVTIPIDAPQQQTYAPRQGYQQRPKPPPFFLTQFICHMQSCYLSY